MPTNKSKQGPKRKLRSQAKLEPGFYFTACREMREELRQRGVNLTIHFDKKSRKVSVEYDPAQLAEAIIGAAVQKYFGVSEIEVSVVPKQNSERHEDASASSKTEEINARLARRVSRLESELFRAENENKGLKTQLALMVRADQLEPAEYFEHFISSHAREEFEHASKIYNEAEREFLSAFQTEPTSPIEVLVAEAANPLHCNPRFIKLYAEAKKAKKELEQVQDIKQKMRGLKIVSVELDTSRAEALTKALDEIRSRYLAHRAAYEEFVQRVQGIQLTYADIAMGNSRTLIFPFQYRARKELEPLELAFVNAVLGKEQAANLREGKCGLAVAKLPRGAKTRENEDNVLSYLNISLKPIRVEGQ